MRFTPLLLIAASLGGCPDPVYEGPEEEEDHDTDGDGYVDAAHGGDDCKDSDPMTHPGAVEECDGLDNDCDGSIDCDDTDVPDSDSDGVCECDDCSDFDASNYPGNDEVCDEQDNDCDGDVDEGVEYTDWYPDGDGDGWGNSSDAQATCGVAPSGDWVEQGGDCDDTDDEIHPGADEACDGLDNDCDGDTDEDYRGLSLGTLLCVVDPDSPGCSADSVEIDSGVMTVDMSAHAGMTIALHTEDPEGYVWNIGDSPGNDTGCSDGSMHSHDAEIYQVNEEVVVCSQDEYEWYHVYSNLIPAEGTGWLEVSIAPDLVRLVGEQFCREFVLGVFPLSGWDEQAGANDDLAIQIGMNRVVLADSDRTGDGLEVVELFAW